MENRFLKGAMILSISMFLTKFMGILYIIPFQQLVGPSGIALYQYAYIPYSLFISLSTLGIPVGIAKFISKYNAAGEYDTSRKMFRYGVKVMLCLGLVGFLILYGIAPMYASHVLGGNDKLTNSVEDVTMAIRTVSFALLVIPVMAIFRGFFQGNQNMVPTSVSQFLEQLFRIIFILVGSYVIIHWQGGTVNQAVAFSVFSAFLAGVVAFGTLYYYWRKNSKHYNALYEQSVPHEPREYGKLFVELISYAIPFAILGLMTSLLQLVDQSTYNHYMIKGGFPIEQVESALGIYSGNLYKIIMIPVSFAIAFGQPLVPELTHSLVSGKMEEVKKNIRLAIQLTTFITLPAVVGMSVLAKPIYVLFFNSSTPGLNEMGAEIFTFGAFLGLFMALYSIVTAILQGIGGQWYGIAFLVVSLIIKYIGNVIFIPMFYSHGATLSTVLAYVFCIGASLIVVKRKTGFKVRTLMSDLLPTLLATAIMTLSVLILGMILTPVLSHESGILHSLLLVAISGLVGIAVYFGVSHQLGLVANLLGDKFTFKSLMNKIKRKK